MFTRELQARPQSSALLGRAPVQRQAAQAAAPLLAHSPRTPARLDPAGLLGLHRAFGNQAVQRLIAQRQDGPGEEDDTSLQLQTDGVGPEEDDEAAVQLSPDESQPATDADIGAQIQASTGHGSPLDTQTQRQLESGLGTDLSGVRVHTDSRADQLSRAVNAVAFTSGSDIYFRQGAYSPGSADGQRLLAHEATHVVQQAAGPVAGTPTDSGVSVSDPDDAFERAADATAAELTAPTVQGQWADEAPGG